MAGKSMSISDMIKKKTDKVIKTVSEFRDINRPLLKEIFGISIWGKNAFEEDVVEIIIGEYDDLVGRGKRLTSELYEEAKAAHGSSIRKSGGYLRTPEGRIVLMPKV